MERAPGSKALLQTTEPLQPVRPDVRQRRPLYDRYKELVEKHLAQYRETFFKQKKDLRTEFIYELKNKGMDPNAPDAESTIKSHFENFRERHARELQTGNVQHDTEDKNVAHVAKALAAEFLAAQKGEEHYKWFLVARGPGDTPAGYTPQTFEQAKDSTHFAAFLTTFLIDPNAPHLGRNALTSAVASENLDMIGALIKWIERSESESDKSVLNQPDGNGSTPLTLAAERNNLKVIEALLDAGADVNARNARGQTALQVAAEMLKREAIINKLVAKEADLEAQDEHGHTVLEAAVIRGDVAAVQVLLECGAKVFSEHKTCPGFNAVAAAIAAGQEKTFESLCQWIDKSGSPGDKDLLTAIRLNDKDREEQIRWLITADDDADDDAGKTPLRLACEAGQREWIKPLIVSSADVNARDNKGRMLLHWAVGNRDFETVQTLIRAGADVDATDSIGRSPLHWAVRNRDLEAVQTLSRAKADVNARDNAGRTPLYLAVEDRNLEAVQTLIRAGANVDAPGRGGRTPLHRAVKDNNLEVVKALTDAKANVEARDGEGDRPLHSAVKTGNLEAVKALIGAGADVNAPHITGGTPLHLAAATNNLEAVQRLIDAKADVDARDKRWQTPLYLAIAFGHSEMTQALIKLGGDVNARDPLGRTLLHLAIVHNELNVARALIKQGADVGAVDNTGMTRLQLAIEANLREVIQAWVDSIGKE